MSHYQTVSDLAVDVAGREGIEDISALTMCMQDLLKFEYFGGQFGDLLPSKKELLQKKALRRFWDKQSRSMAQ